MSNVTERGESFTAAPPGIRGGGKPFGKDLSKAGDSRPWLHDRSSPRDRDRWHLLQGEGPEGARSLVSRPTRDPHRGLDGRVRVAGRGGCLSEGAHDLGPGPRPDDVLREERRALH